jgi:hypothetical protein
MPGKQLDFENGHPVDAPREHMVDCQADDCDFSVAAYLAAFAFADGCPKCGH